MSRRWLFAFFLVSGFCSLVYEVVWLRLAMAGYGVTTALTSIVLSVFMGGLALGSWGSGRVVTRLSSPVTLLRLYALCEGVMALSARVVPALLTWGREPLLTGGAGWNSGTYHLASGLVITLVLMPFCVFMGATFPLGVALLGSASGGSRAFSYLYLANVIGATAGTLTSALVLIEILGFTGTLALVSGLNALLAASALAMSLSSRLRGPSKSVTIETAGATTERFGAFALVALFTTGLVSMGMEIVWIRSLTPYLGTVVYSFAIILGLYLAATFTGSAVYRRLAQGGIGVAALGPRFWVLLALAGLLPMAATDPNAWFPPSLFGGIARAALAIVPFCGVVGFLTPLLTDRWSQGKPDGVGTAYALNVLGCVLGPLVAGFLLLPILGERGTLLVLSSPILLAAARPVARPRNRGLWLVAGLLMAALITWMTRGPETSIPGALVRYDSTATVTAFGRGMERQIRVNGIGMTVMSPITKMMAHLALGFHEPTPRSALVICFGMGTSFRSALSWGIPTTAVELVPSVPSFFDYFHEDAKELMRSPQARVVIDDGRRFLDRSHDFFDVILVDPPPPMEAAASSLLYSREFYASAKKRLAPGGVLQQWLPGASNADPILMAAVVKAVTTSFPHVRAFRSMEDWGIHLLASEQPLSQVTAEVLAARLPPRATQDMLEWGPQQTGLDQFSSVMARELPVQALLNLAPNVAPLSDDRPVNEYFLLRLLFATVKPQSASAAEKSSTP